MAQHALAGSASAHLDADILLARALGEFRTYLYAWPDRALVQSERAVFEALLARRVLGEPIAYITGQREFWSLPLAVHRHVLIPRPETELLVETALSRLQKSDACVADLGTGSGAIALALASERPDWLLTATDQSAEALRQANDNAIRLGITNVLFREGSWCEALADHDFDLIVSNPPYIDPKDPHLERGDLRFEPRAALVAELQGIADILCICTQAPAYLRPGAWLMLEHGFEQGEQVRNILKNQQFTHIETLHDLAGNERVSIGQRQ